MFLKILNVSKLNQFNHNIPIGDASQITYHISDIYNGGPIDGTLDRISWHPEGKMTPR